MQNWRICDNNTSKETHIEKTIEIKTKFRNEIGEKTLILPTDKRILQFIYNQKICFDSM